VSRVATSAPSLEPSAREGGWGLALFVIVIGAFMSILDSSIVNIAIPTIENQFNVDTQTAQWVVTIYLLALGVVVPASAWLGDRFGLKRIYIFSLTVFTLGSALCGMSWDITSLAFFRVVQAFGGGLIMPVTMSLVYRIVPRDRIGTAMGFWGLALITAPAIGPTLGGYLVEYVNWRLIFYVNLPVGVFGVLAAMATLPEFPGHRVGPLDWGGLATAAGGLFMLLLALSEGATWGWTSEAIVLLLVAAAFLLAIFVYLQLTNEHPLLDLRVFRYGSFTITNILSILVAVGMYAGVFYVPLYLQTVEGYGAMQTGLIMMPAALVTAVFMPIAGRLYDRIGARWPAFVGLLFMAFGTYLLRNLSMDTPSYVVTEWMMVRSIGMGLAMMPLTTAGMSAIPTPKIGAASSLNNILQRIAGSFGLAVLTSVLTDRAAAHAATVAASYSPATLGATMLQQLTGYVAHAGMTMSQAGQVSLTYLAGQIQAQAFTLGVDDIFVLTALISVVGAVLALFVKTYRTQGARPAAPVD
jgi:EmrB/QacA subfamily drug resistance transporter